MGRDGGGACELCVGVHTTHGVGHTVRGRTSSHVIGVQRTAGTTAGSNGEVTYAVLLAPLLVGAGNGVLEAGGVGGVTGDGNANVLQLHDSNALGNVVGAVALNVCTGTLGVSLLVNDLDFLGEGIELGVEAQYNDLEINAASHASTVSPMCRLSSTMPPARSM